MARAKFQAPKGTQDVLPPVSARWERLLAAYATTVERAGYGLLQSPMFEEIGVFQRESEGADAVRKEMYDFDDKGGRRIALRPEGTASVVRAYRRLALKNASDRDFRFTDSFDARRDG